MKTKVKRIANLMGGLFFAQNLLAQKTGSVDPNYLPNLLTWVVFGLGMAVFVFALFKVFQLFFTIIEIQKIKLLKEQGIEIAEPVKVLNQKTFLERAYEWWVGLKPMEKEADILLDHNYDGIKELDNSLPPWWLAMFYISIVFAGAYLGVYHYFESRPLQAEEYALEMQFAEEQKARYLARQANAVNESNVVALTDPGHLETGELIYQTNCAACHGQLGEGGVGPNLTDQYWLHGGDIKSVFKTIKYGVPEKGMIAWQSQLRPAAIHDVASFIMTLPGTNPPNGKEAQGVLFQPEELNNPMDTITQIGMN